MWSLATFLDKFTISYSMAICRIRSRTRSATLPLSTRFRYFGIQTRCTFRSCFVCAPNWQRFMPPHYTALDFASR